MAAIMRGVRSHDAVPKVMALSAEGPVSAQRGERGDKQRAGRGVGTSFDEQTDFDLAPVAAQSRHIDALPDDRSRAVEQVAGEAGDMPISVARRDDRHEPPAFELAVVPTEELGRPGADGDD